jgi:hypothetical protein
MLALGEAAESNSRMLSDNADRVRQALASEDYAAIASSSGVVTEATGQLELIAGQAEEASSGIEEVVWKIQDGNGSLLDDEWQQVLLAVSEIRRLASRMRPSLESLRSGSGASEALSAALQGMVESIATMDAAPRDEAGSVRYPSSVFDLDVEVVQGLEASLTGESATLFPEDSATAIQWLMSKIVLADKALAQRAVEYTSTEVGRAMDRLEAHYKRTSGFDESARGNDRQQAYEPVDRAMRGNSELESARESARAAREALVEAGTLEARGPGSWGEAVSKCRDAWAHSIAAGQAGGRSQTAVSGG